MSGGLGHRLRCLFDDDLLVIILVILLILMLEND
jgi:hypothetical protein